MTDSTSDPTLGWDAFWLTTLDEGGEHFLWELIGDARNFFPDASANELADVAEKAARKLVDEGWARIVDSRDLEIEPDEVESIFRQGEWRSYPPVPDDDANLVPRPKWNAWTAEALRRGALYSENKRRQTP